MSVSTSEILDEVIGKMQQAQELLDEALENESLDNYYGYSINIIKQELDKLSNNSAMYHKNIEEMVGTEGENWNDELHDIDLEDFL